MATKGERVRVTHSELKELSKKYDDGVNDDYRSKDSKGMFTRSRQTQIENSIDYRVS